MNRSSGIGSEDSALKAFFESIENLELPYDHGEDSDNPSIDLNQVKSNKHEERAKYVAIRPPSPIKLDPLIEYLQLMLDQFEKNSSYSARVAEGMLKGLEKDFPHLYQPFITRNLPINYIPIIKFNNVSAPYIEFLLKAELSDETPTLQLNGFRDEHLAFSRVFVDRLLDRVTTRQRRRHSTPGIKLAPGQSLLVQSTKKVNNNTNTSTISSVSTRSLPRRKCREGNSTYRI